MTSFTQFDRTVASMMSKYGGTATLNIATGSTYNPATSENVPAITSFTVNAMFFDYVRKNEGTGDESKTLVQSGDKQVYIQPTQKADTSAASIPAFNAASATLTAAGKNYRVITVKQLNTNMTDDGCVLYELYVRE